MFPERLETERLSLVRFGHDTVDLHELYRALSADEMERVSRFMPWEPHATIRETYEFVERAEERWEDHRRATYAIRPREGEPDAGAYAGNATLAFDWRRRTAKPGIWLRKPFWGRGYSGERAAALLELAFDELDLELVAVTHNVANENARRSIERYVDRFGGQRDGLLRNWTPYRGEVADAYRYTITRDGYREATDATG
jgi:RimJ/RimL family protein N-acetyltransferase